jgi:hypothetical protein
MNSLKFRNFCTNQYTRQVEAHARAAIRTPENIQDLFIGLYNTFVFGEDIYQKNGYDFSHAAVDKIVKGLSIAIEGARENIAVNKKNS